jgi:hypothetical protein
MCKNCCRQFNCRWMSFTDRERLYVAIGSSFIPLWSMHPFRMEGNAVICRKYQPDGQPFKLGE